MNDAVEASTQAWLATMQACLARLTPDQQEHRQRIIIAWARALRSAEKARQRLRCFLAVTARAGPELCDTLEVSDGRYCARILEGCLEVFSSGMDGDSPWECGSINSGMEGGLSEADALAAVNIRQQKERAAVAATLAQSDQPHIVTSFAR